jgi:hypothetical protein
MNLFSADLNSLSFTDLEEFLAVKEEQLPSEGVQIDYKLKEPVDFPDTVAAQSSPCGSRCTSCVRVSVRHDRDAVRDVQNLSS